MEYDYMDVFSVLILGAGKIAAGYDDIESNLILTHAHAIKKLSTLQLLGFYDKDYNKAVQSARKWGGKAYEKLDYADIIAICTPDDIHLDSICQAVAFSPKLIILEKPIARNYYDIISIQKAVGNIPVQVNFSRRFAMKFQRLAIDIKEYGNFITGMGLYGKGYIHNGSHMLDLLRLLIGDAIKVDCLSEISDFCSEDKTKTVTLHYNGGGMFCMCGIDCRNYTIFELDLCFEKARIRILNGGKDIQIYKQKSSEEYPGYVNLSLFDEKPSGMEFAMTNLYKNAIGFLTNKNALLSPLEKSISKELYII